MPGSEQILTVEQMRAAEQALIDGGSSVEALMDSAGRGAAEWVWRIAGHHKITVLCGPGNNGGDGYVIAETLRERGCHVAVVGAVEPRTDAACNARSLYKGEVVGPDVECKGDAFVDCLFGSGLSRPLTAEHSALVARLAGGHRHRIAVDLPSGVHSDNGLLLGEQIPDYDLTLALGAWKFAHFLMPAAARMGEMRLIPIGIDPVEGAARVISRPRVSAPQADAHKYTRGLLAIVSGQMPGAALLASAAAQRAGAGYVKLFTEDASGAPADLVAETGNLSEVLVDDRNRAVLVGPGLGRNGKARERLAVALADKAGLVVDADALLLLAPRMLVERCGPTIATPHEGEFLALERAFGVEGTGSKPERARALAEASGMVIVAKGPDTVVAAPDGRLACAPRASAWLSTAGTGDVLAGMIASRLATGVGAFEAACEGVWLHGEAARLAGPASTAGDIAAKTAMALAACL